jgi:indolepyruvate ferredoxin oxidoreductase alpha subunit
VPLPAAATPDQTTATEGAFPAGKGSPQQERGLTARTIHLGNEAIALGLLEGGCTLAASYPGTPASEILATLIRHRQSGKLPIHLEWSINEKVAFEVALANSYAGRRSAVIMKQVGLNVAADPFMSAAYTGVKGGLVVVVADDPGPHSSQTEQDSRFFAMMAKVPVLDPSTPEEARRFARLAMEISERYEIPVMLRPTTRVCHARQDLATGVPAVMDAEPAFRKSPARWAATPKFRLLLHRELNEKIQAIARDGELLPSAVEGFEPPGARRPCIVASGVVLAHVREILGDLGPGSEVTLYAVPMPHPLPPSFRDAVLRDHDRILVLEETQPVMELQLQDRAQVSGRLNGTVPSAGELLPETVEGILRSFLGLPPALEIVIPAAAGRRPTLCAGCAHRAAFFAIKKAFPKGIYPGDIGCYTLGLNLGAVDTVLCMGAAVSQASGFYHAYRSRGPEAPPICATIGDSTFFHAGVPPLMNAVVQDARFTLVILDNSTTAMTGHQPTPAGGVTLEGKTVPALSIEAIVEACGVRFVRAIDPYRLGEMIDLLKEADAHVRAKDGGVAVVVARRPCLMDRSQARSGEVVEILVTSQCVGCGLCVKLFECPALIWRQEKEPIEIDRVLCSGCGACVHVCPHEALAASRPSGA